MTREELTLLLSNISFTPEKYAEREISELEASISSFREFVHELAKKPGADAGFNPEEEARRYEEKARQLRESYWHALGRCASPAITGPANFPVERNRKAWESAERKARAIEEHAKKARAAAKRKAFPYGDTESGEAIRSGDPAAIEKLRKRITEAEKAHEFGKLANRAYRKEGIEGLRKIGWPADAVETAIRFEKRGYPVQPYFAENGSARIRRMKERLKVLEARAAKNDAEIRVGDVIVRENSDIMRVQIIFPGKPDADMRAMLKRNGFRWAPSQGAWQRHLNNNGIMAANRIIREMKERAQ